MSAGAVPVTKIAIRARQFQVGQYQVRRKAILQDLPSGSQDRFPVPGSKVPTTLGLISSRQADVRENLRVFSRCGQESGFSLFHFFFCEKDLPLQVVKATLVPGTGDRPWELSKRRKTWRAFLVSPARAYRVPAESRSLVCRSASCACRIESASNTATRGLP